MEFADYAKFVLALAFVLGLIGLLAVAARRFGLNGLPRSQIRRGQERRIGMVEVTALDPKRRLVLIRRDGVEHLVILGPEGETVVETGIRAPQTHDSFAQTLDKTRPSSLEQTQESGS